MKTKKIFLPSLIMGMFFIGIAFFLIINKISMENFIKLLCITLITSGTFDFINSKDKSLLKIKFLGKFFFTISLVLNTKILFVDNFLIFILIILFEVLVSMVQIKKIKNANKSTYKFLLTLNVLNILLIMLLANKSLVAFISLRNIFAFFYIFVGFTYIIYSFEDFLKI